MNNLTLESLFTQWYEQTQETRIAKGYLHGKVGSTIKSVEDIYALDRWHLGIHSCDRNITAKQMKLVWVLWKKAYYTPDFRSKHGEFITINMSECGTKFTDRSINARVYQRSNGSGIVAFKLKEYNQ
jgi:hypothetical protein